MVGKRPFKTNGTCGGKPGGYKQRVTKGKDGPERDGGGGGNYTVWGGCPGGKKEHGG